MADTEYSCNEEKHPGGKKQENICTNESKQFVKEKEGKTGDVAENERTIKEYKKIK